MCGLCGVIQFAGQPLDPAIAGRMLDNLRHRGPDDRGTYQSRNGLASAFLGHARLSILDLSSAGRQPIANETGRVWVVFNGEIYNFQDLRTELEALGHRFHSKTDSEVIVHAYEQFGDDCVRRLDGMFAFALWDEERERLLLARDRSGKKPLYYYLGSNHCIFASEIKALFVHPAVKREMDPQAIPFYFNVGYVPTPGTFYRDVLQVPPASYLVVEQGRAHKPISYWDWPLEKEGTGPPASEEDAIREVRRLLEAAVQRRLISDVPLGAFLSGGIDSSIVVGLMSRLMGRPVKTFSIGFAGDATYDETAYARTVARHFRTDHTEFIVAPKAFELVERLLWHHDQPYGDSSAIPTYILSHLTREHVTVALTGDGGDELFAGYQRFLAAQLAESLPRPLISLGLYTLDALPPAWRLRGALAKAHRLLVRAHQPLADRYLGWCSFVTPELLAELLPASSKADLGFVFRGCLDKSREADLINRLLYLNFKTYLPDDLLVKVDRMSMAHALEARSPFLDTDLIEYVAGLPGRYKLKGTTLKYILKKAFADLLPPDILARGKQGFGVPVGTWMRGELKELVEDVLLCDAPRYRPYVRQDCVRRIYREHQERVRERGGELWALFNFELWLRQTSA